jgi:lipoate-protein ligase A
LATEEWIFREMDPATQAIFLWQNDNTVVVGRNQNPWSECNLEKMESDGVRLARRTSGGGAVFHDLGNLCFTFLSPREGYDRGANSALILRALQALGVAAEANGRNDLVLASPDGPRKFSGAAFRETRDRCFHHGTLLVDANLGRLAQYLTPHPKKLQSKGRASVRARVANLSEVAPGLSCAAMVDAILSAFFAQWGASRAIEALEPATLAAIPSWRESYERFSSWDWRFGHAPCFQQQMSEHFSWGFVEAHIDSEAGKIERARLFSDALDCRLSEALEASLQGRPFTREGARLAERAAISLVPEYALEIAEFSRWFEGHVEI